MGGEGVTPTSACQGLDRNQGSRAAAVLRYAMSFLTCFRGWAVTMALVVRRYWLLDACQGLTNEPALSRRPDDAEK